MSYADQWTDKQLESLEKRIAEVYSEAQKDLEKTAKDYFDKFAERDEKELARLENGEITKQQYQQWRLAQMGRGERFNRLASEMAHRATATNEVAVAYVNDVTPSIYTLNYNHEAYMIEKLGFDMKVGEEFTLINEQTVKRMIADNPDVMPYYPPARAVKRGIDLEYGQKYIKKHVTSGILQGKGVGKIADDLQRDLTNMNRASALRTARTAITSAQNGGRQATMERAVEMGIPIQKKWKCTHDSHTRHEHGQADGQTVPVDEPFIVGGEKLMHPGDTSGSGWNIYNCRCVEGSVEKEGIIAEKRQMRVRNPETGENELVEDMTYEEWARARGIKPKKTKAKTIIQEKTQFAPAASIEEAEKYADRFVDPYKTKYTGVVDYSGIQLDYANEMNRAFTEVFEAYETKHRIRNIKPFNMREARFKGTDAEAAYQWGTCDMFFNKGYYKTEKAFKAHVKQYSDLMEQVLPNIDMVIEQYRGVQGSIGKAKLRYMEALKRTGRTNVNPPDAYGSTIHEMGHYLDDELFRKSFRENGFDLSESFERFSGNISAYATSNTQEYVAESFAAYWKGETDILDPNLVKIFEGAKKK